MNCSHKKKRSYRSYKVKNSTSGFVEKNLQFINILSINCRLKCQLRSIKYRSNVSPTNHVHASRMCLALLRTASTKEWQ